MDERAEIDPRRLEELRRRALLRSHHADGGAAVSASVLVRDTLRAFLTNELSVTERRIVVLDYVERMTAREIGAALDLSPVRVAEIRRSIRERIRARILAGPLEPGCTTPRAKPPERRRHYPFGRGAKAGRKRVLPGRDHR